MALVMASCCTRSRWTRTASPRPGNSRSAWAAARCTLVALAVLVAWQPTLLAAPTVQERATDMLALAGGERLFGMLLGPPSGFNGVNGEKIGIVVERQWFRRHCAELYRKTTANEDQRRRQSLEQLRERLIAWGQRRREPKLLADFVERSLRETEKRLKALDDAQAPPAPSQLVLVEVPQAQVRNQYAQPAATRRVLALAWQERLADVEEQTAVDLVKQLEAKRIDVELAPADLSDRLGPVLADERQWAAKVALVEYQILGKPYFQGTGNKLVRDDNGEVQPDLSELLAGQLEDQVGDLLGELLGTDAGAAKQNREGPLAAALADAEREAAAEDFNGLRVSYLSQDLGERKATVRARFLARMPDGSWQPIWEHTATIDAGKPRPNEEQDLANDPQIAGILKLAKSLGLGLDDAQLRTALRFGAATKEALQEADREFAPFMQRNVRQLDGPPIMVPDGAAR